MDVRPSRCGRLVALGTMTAALLALAGCTNALFTAMYLIKGNAAPAEFKLPKEKSVVVVCRPVASLQYCNARVDQDLAHVVSDLLKHNLPKIKVVDPRKASEWMDENPWQEFVEVGRGLKADLVVGIDLEQFQLYQGQTLYKGQATTDLKVYDCKTGEIVFRKRPPQIAYPPNRSVQTSERQEAEFRQEFVHHLADQVAGYFYDHDPYLNFALDSKTIE